MDKIEPIGKDSGLVKIYKNWCMRKPTQEEIYEADIRKSIARPVPTYDSIEIVRV